MHRGIRFVLELPTQEPAVRLGELRRLGKHTAPFECGGCQYDPCAEEAHQSAPLNAEVLSHGHNERIAFLCAHHSEPDTGIPARRLDYRLSWSKLSRALGIFDDSESQSVLEGPHGVEGFYPDVQAYLRGRELLDSHHRCASNRFEDAVKPVPSKGFPCGAGDRYVACFLIHCHVFALHAPHHLGALPADGTLRRGEDYYELSGKIATSSRSFSSPTPVGYTARPAVELEATPELLRSGGRRSPNTL